MLYFRQIGMYQNRKIAMHDFESKLSLVHDKNYKHLNVNNL
jgi:hypothetical protein